MISSYRLLAILGMFATSALAAPAADTVPAVSYPYEDTLVGGQFLKQNEGLISANGAYNMILQTDGNLVIYQLSNWGTPSSYAVWATQTSGQTVDHASMQTDGNFVLYGADDRARWSSNSYGYNYGVGYKLVLKNDGSFTVYSEGEIVTLGQGH